MSGQGQRRRGAHTSLDHPVQGRHPHHGWPGAGGGEQSPCRVRPGESAPINGIGGGPPLLQATDPLAEMEVGPAGQPLLFLGPHDVWGAGDPAGASLPVCASASPSVLSPEAESHPGLESLHPETNVCLSQREGPGLLAPCTDKPGVLPEASEPLLRSPSHFLP